MRLLSPAGAFRPIALLVFGALLSGASGDLRIYWTDVDGGAATLIVTPAGESVLIDSGENLDVHAQRMFNVAKVAGVKKIDHFVISHWHADHYGGTAKLKSMLPIQRVYDNNGGVPEAVLDDPVFSTLAAMYRKANQGATLRLKPGDRVPLASSAGLPPLILRCLASRRDLLPAKNTAANPQCAGTPAPPKLDDGENAKSLVLILEYGNFRFLATGDLTWHMEEKLVCPNDRIGKVDLFQISHHGLDLSNNPKLIRTIAPKVVVINNSENKGAEENTMKTLKSIPTIQTVWQLHKNPRIADSLNTSPRHIANKPQTRGNYLQATVRQNGSFSVRTGDTAAAQDNSRIQRIAKNRGNSTLN